MKKSIKITSAILTAGLLISPLSGLSENFSNVAKATNLEIRQSEIVVLSETDIKEIDKYILNYQNQLVLDKVKLEKFLSEKNFSKDKVVKITSTIEGRLIQLNSKINTGWYKIDPTTKGITQKYQFRYTYASGLEVYEPWWGYQYYIKSQSAANDYKFRIQNVANQANSLFGWFPIGSWYVNNADRMANAGVEAFNAYGSAKVSIYLYTPGIWYNVEPIQ